MKTITVKSLREDAKILGIKGYSKMTKAQLILATEKARAEAQDEFFIPSDVAEKETPLASDSEQEPNMLDAMSGDLMDDDESEEVSASTQETPAANSNDNKRIPSEEDTIIVPSERSTQPLVKYVKSNNLMVEFLVRGKRVIVGWSKKDYKMYIYKESTGTSFITSYSTQIFYFSEKVNGQDGDIALVVAALKRIRNKPAQIILLENKHKSEGQTVVKPERSSASKENTYPNRGVVHPVILNKLITSYSNHFNVPLKDARRAGHMIQKFFSVVLPASVNEPLDTVINSYVESL